MTETGLLPLLNGPWLVVSGRLAGVVAMGFLMLVPLQLFALQKQSSRIETRQNCNLTALQ